MARLFGTDGVRGSPTDITAELALDLAVAAAHVLGEVGRRSTGTGPSAVVGRDPRASGEFLSAAVVAGLASAGVDVLDAGVLPTPAIAFLTADLDADLGVMLSASHNPMPDNGIKFFARGGHKLADEVEDAHRGRAWASRGQRPTGAGVGRIATAAPTAATATSPTCSRRCRTASTASTSSSTAPTARPRRLARGASRGPAREVS